MPPHAPAFLLRRSLAWLFLLLSLGPGILLASRNDAARRNFDVPAGNAAQTLKRFAAQADCEIMFLAEPVGDRRTNAVKGELAVSEALERLLANTGLAAVRDEKSGALMVQPDAARRTAAATSPFVEPTPTNPKIMNPTKRAAWLGSLFALMTAAEPLSAQTATPAAPAPATKAEEAVILSPFEVSTARDSGFVAASAVAGGRLAIDLKDAPVAYSVLNKEFLDALQITGLEQAADWAPNTTRVPDHGHENTWGGSVLVSSRGVSSFFAQRDFFQMQMDFDSYNMDRFDYGRGPNAVLFGFASFGGTQNVVSKQARLDRNFGETRLSYGSWDNRRGTLDYNLRVGKDAALRVNLLGQRAQGWRDGEFNNRKAIHIAGKIRLGQRTEFRAEAERGWFDMNTPYHTYYDGILGWDGKTIYNGRQATQPTAAAAGVVSYGNLNTGVNSFIYAPVLSKNNIIDVMGLGRTTAVTTATRLGGAAFRAPTSSIIPARAATPFKR